MTVREAAENDWPQIWPIFREIVREQTTFAYDPDMSEDEARRMWMLGDPARTVVAVADDQVLGTASMYPNRAGPGSHVASASFMVDAAARGRRVGRTLVEDMIAWARRTGFVAVQFNAVVETNAAAVRLYEDLDFRTIGIAPGAFRHPTEGDVGLRIMWLDLHAG